MCRESTDIIMVKEDLVLYYLVAKNHKTEVGTKKSQKRSVPCQGAEKKLAENQMEDVAQRRVKRTGLMHSL